MINSGLQNRVGSIEVAVRKMITHPRDLRPRYRRLGGKQLGWQGFDCLPDLQQPDTNCVKDQPIGQTTATQMRMDRLDRRLNV